MSEFRSMPSLQPQAAAGFRFAVVVSRFNAPITSRLEEGAVTTLLEYGADDPRVLYVPGAYELPMAAHRLALGGDVDAVICVGALIRGDTAHFDVLAQSTANAIQDVVRHTGIPVSFGLITCENLAQAEARAGGAHGNKGVEAAFAAIEMAALFTAIGGG